MFSLLLVHYSPQPTAARRDVARHVEYLERHHRDGTFLLSGPAQSDHISEVILAVGSPERVEQLTAEDPLVAAGMATYEIVAVDPARHDDLLAQLLVTAAADDEAWTNGPMTRLRSGDSAVLREGRPLTPVLQHAGQALLQEDAAGNEDLVGRCIAELHDRAAVGDVILAMELQAMLGIPVAAGEYVPWPLTPVPVSLRELAGCLDGDPLQGNGAVDLLTGDVYCPGSLEFDPPPEMDEESESFDLDRWLFFRPESGEGYRDMLDFTAGLPEGWLRERLLRALDSRGAFRRFRDVLADAPEVHLTRWSLFRDERELGRAREWLATAGYRSDPRLIASPRPD